MHNFVMTGLNARIHMVLNRELVLYFMYLCICTASFSITLLEVDEWPMLYAKYIFCIDSFYID